MYKVEILTDRGYWVLHRWKYTQEGADTAAKDREEAGYRIRVIYQGKIVWESVGE